MRKIKLILTASGCPGASTLIRYLKNNGEREIEIVGTDMDKEAIGRFMCDKFYQTPPSNSKDFIPFLLYITEKEKPDVIFPQSSYDVYPVSLNKDKFERLGAKVLVSDPEPIKIANNKYRMYEVLKGKVDLPRYFYPKNIEEFIKYAKELGYPQKAICFKPHESKGSRGFRFIDPKANKRDQLLNQKPNNRYISFEEAVNILKEGEFPKLLLMEKIEGEEYDAMALCLKGEVLLTTVKTRERSRWGVITNGELVYKPEIIENVKKIISEIPLSYNISLQFIGTKLIEINPRTSTYIYQKDLIEPYLAIKLLLGEITPEEIRKYQNKIDYGRRMVRYMDQIFWKP